MQQIVIHVQDKEKAKLLFELLSAIDFIDFIDAGDEETELLTHHGSKESVDFFALAGLWQGREISLDTIRQKAWPSQ